MAPINRRDFLKTAGGGTLAMSGLYSFTYCTGGQKNIEKEKGEMTYRIHPENKDKVSLLGYGCMRWPMIKDDNGNDIVDQETTNQLVDHAIANGVNYFDVAPVYLQGQCEKATGIALKRHPRESFFIATKLSRTKDNSRKSALEMYNKSFKDLQVDYIDYYLLHNIGRGGMEAFNKRFVDNGVIDFLLEERKAGRIRNLGFSFHGAKDAFDEFLALHEKYHWDFVQIQLNWMDWKYPNSYNTAAEYLQSELDKKGIPSIIMEPLLGGRLAKLPDNVVDLLKTYQPQSSVASWAFRFAGSPNGVLTVLSGMTYMEHLKDNLNTYTPLNPLSEKEYEVLAEVAEIMTKHPIIPCNDCKYCMPCPYGIDIPSILLYYNKCVNEGNISGTSASDNYQKARRAFLVGYDRAVPKLRQANRCIGCRKCVEHCPQKIDIPIELRKIDRYIEKLKQDTL